MKIALYIEDGLEQIVLTPGSKTEANILGKLHDGSREISIKRGTFYGCQGGWTRWKDRPDYGYSFAHRDDDESTMIVLRPAPVDRSPEGEDRLGGLHAEHESAVLSDSEAGAQPLVSS